MFTILQANGQAQQVTISKDDKGRIVTVIYQPKIKTGFWKSTYLGSPYFGNTEWHPAELVYRNQNSLPVAMSYNLIFNQIQCRLSDSAQVFWARPDEFVFEGKHFINYPYRALGKDRANYYEVLYDGNTKLLRKWRRRLDRVARSRYDDDLIDGQFTAWSDLYLWKPGENPTYVTLDLPSIRKVLPELYFENVKDAKLTELALIDALTLYDNLPKRIE